MFWKGEGRVPEIHVDSGEPVSTRTLFRNVLGREGTGDSAQIIARDWAKPGCSHPGRRQSLGNLFLTFDGPSSDSTAEEGPTQAHW